MIEGERADRIGLTLLFARDRTEAVARARPRLTAMGVRLLRLPVDLRDVDDLRWAAWLLTHLSDAFDVTLAIQASATVRLAALLAAAGAAGQAVEIVDDGTAGPGQLAAAAEAVRRSGRRAVLGVAAGGLAAAGAGSGFDALGVAAPPADGVAMPVWVTLGGASARGGRAAEARAFLGAANLPVERVYWAGLLAPDAVEPPELLERLLASGGVAEVARVAALADRMAAPAILRTRPVLVTGGAGFIGANLVDRLAADGHHVLIYDALARAGVERNLHWLARRHPAQVSFELGDLRDEPALSEAAGAARAVFHLAGQVAVTTSMMQPLADFEVNARGTLALLEALRLRNPAAPLIFASTNKVYGDLADVALVRHGESYLPADHALRAGVPESRALCFHTPYGCSKGAADQYVLDYAHSFGLRTAVLRMSCIYGERQLGTEDQGWVAHFLLRAIAGEGLTIYGDGRQVRDVLHVGDAVAAYLSAWTRIDAVAGRAYNLGGGPANAISLLQLVAHIEDLLGQRVDTSFAAWRPGDQRYFVADTAAARHDLGLAPPLGWRAGVARLAAHFGAVPQTAAAQ